MTNRFLISVAAAALIAGTGFANAQGTNREGGAAGGAATQSAPSSERAAPSGAMNHDSGATKGAESPGMKGSEKSGMKAESNEKMPAAKSAQDTKMDPKGEKSKSMSSENDSAKGGMKAEGSKTEGSKAEGSKAEGTKATEGTKTNGNMNAEGSKANGNMNAQTQNKGGMDSKTTTGNAATSATAAPPAEKRTQIVSAIKTEKIEETTNVNFNISVGATIPGTVRFHPLSPRIVEIYPEWRGYDVIFVHGQYIIVRPQTHEIVYIIEG